MITKQAKADIVGKFGKTPSDTGSSRSQIAILSERIKSISSHLKGHTKDFSSQRGLLKLVGRRRRLLEYLKSFDRGGYAQIIKQLDLRK
jgi:small subunit ribosomal protein S15